MGVPIEKASQLTNSSYIKEELAKRISRTKTAVPGTRIMHTFSDVGEIIREQQQDANFKTIADYQYHNRIVQQHGAIRELYRLAQDRDYARDNGKKVHIEEIVVNDEGNKADTNLIISSPTFAEKLLEPTRPVDKEEPQVLLQSALDNPNASAPANEPVKMDVAQDLVHNAHPPVIVAADDGEYDDKEAESLQSDLDGLPKLESDLDGLKKLQNEETPIVVSPVVIPPVVITPSTGVPPPIMVLPVVNSPRTALTESLYGDLPEASDQKENDPNDTEELNASAANRTLEMIDLIDENKNPAPSVAATAGNTPMVPPTVSPPPPPPRSTPISRIRAAVAAHRSPNMLDLLLPTHTYNIMNCCNYECARSCSNKSRTFTAANCQRAREYCAYHWKPTTADRFLSAEESANPTRYANPYFNAPATPPSTVAPTLQPPAPPGYTYVQPPAPPGYTYVQPAAPAAPPGYTYVQPNTGTRNNIRYNNVRYVHPTR